LRPKRNAIYITNASFERALLTCQHRTAPFRPFILVIEHPLVFSKDHASLSLEERAEFLDQELNHVRQHLLGPTGEHLGDSAASFVSSPIGIKAKAALQTTRGYGLDKNDHLAALEIGERLMRPGGHEELGISGAERDVLADQYMRSLRKEYGYKAQSVIDRIRKASRS
jgi:hypothetical protein